MPSVRDFVLRRAIWLVTIVVAGTVYAPSAHAQLQITEVMHSPLGSASLWEWVEVRNTSASPIDLDGWILDDDDDVPVSAAIGSNIKAVNGNTVIPAGGVAVLYAGSDLGFTPSRFTNAWGGAITLIGVQSLTTLTATDAIGLWPNRAAYDADNQSSPRGFAHASVALNYASGFPEQESGRSIAWNGAGSFSSGANWVTSEANLLQARVSTQTKFESVPINGADRGNPGRMPGGISPPGLRITEIMYRPESAGPGWEWVEVLNNTGAAINFATQKHVLHDNDGADFAEPNIVSGVLPQGGVGVLFNAEDNTLANMQAAWGAGINFIPVTTWGNSFSNSGDTVAIWSSIENYNLDTAGAGRSTAHAAVAVTYEASGPWPTSDEESSIFVKGLNFNPADGANWIRSGADGDTLGSVIASPVIGTLVDHPGGDVGSPGKVGAASVGVLGDYNGNSVVDAADYTAWRDRLGGGSLPNDSSPGGVTSADYTYWKSRFGATAGGAAVSAVPEPTNYGMWLAAAATATSSIRRRPALRSLLQPARR